MLRRSSHELRHGPSGEAGHTEGELNDRISSGSDAGAVSGSYRALLFRAAERFIMKLPVLIQAIFLLALLPPAGCGKIPPSPEPEKGGGPEKAASIKTVPAPEKTEPHSPQAEALPPETPETDPKPAIASAIESLTGSLGYNLDGQEEGDPKAELEKGLSLQKQGRYTLSLIHI